MTWEMMLKERHDDGIAIGEKRGITKGKIETARNMLKNGISADLITKCTGISAQQISELL
ncbi:MAG: hypothetical protein HDR53_07235 [Treponema sp.]|nr:hypothetical protein [Treponema sp.]